MTGFGGASNQGGAVIGALQNRQPMDPNLVGVNVVF
jgi:hypothetical protein